MSDGNKETLRSKIDIMNRIVWILAVTIVLYLFILSIPEAFLSGRGFIRSLVNRIGYETNAVQFIADNYLMTIFPFVGILIYTAVTKRNRFVLRSFLPGHENNRLRQLVYGLIVGFAMNFACIVCAMINGDIKLYINFMLSQIPFYIFALVCVFIQSSSEEMWCRGFIYERIRIRYPLWVAILVNGVFFAALHMFNPGVSFLPIFDIAVCGVSFSLAKWYTNSIWFPMGIHTSWNFTQNLIFGLPNSGLISEASIFGLDAASARDSAVYNVAFGVEGAIPAVVVDALLGIICIILAARNGRLGELSQKLDEEVYINDIKKEEVNYVYKNM